MTTCVFYATVYFSRISLKSVYIRGHGAWKIANLGKGWPQSTAYYDRQQAVLNKSTYDVANILFHFNTNVLILFDIGINWMSAKQRLEATEKVVL